MGKIKLLNRKFLCWKFTDVSIFFWSSLQSPNMSVQNCSVSYLHFVVKSFKIAFWLALQVTLGNFLTRIYTWIESAIKILKVNKFRYKWFAQLGNKTNGSENIISQDLTFLSAWPKIFHLVIAAQTFCFDIFCLQAYSVWWVLWSYKHLIQNLQIHNEYLIKCDDAHYPSSISFSVKKLVYGSWINYIIIILYTITFDYKHANFSEMANQLRKISMPNRINNEVSLNKFVFELENKFHNLMNEFVPTFQLKTRSFPQWFSNELIW